MERYKIDLRNAKLDGRVLDIGGGGEGVISRHAGDTVIAIDKLKGELEESPDVGIKIVMDATDMQFLDNAFDNATCFFSLMYMSDETIKKSLTEAHRVLKSGGSLWIWDVIIPPSNAANSFVIQLAIMLANEEIPTGYGVNWNKAYKGQAMQDIAVLCEKIGFNVAESSESEKSFFLKAVKK